MQNTPNPSEDALRPSAQLVRERHWSLSAVAGAVALVSAFTTADAWALALGRVTVQSLLGEPLRAEIDVPSITDEEAASLQVGMAAPERFRAANMEYNALLGDVTFELVKRPDGRSVIRLRSNRAVSEPFLDMVVQATWASGQLLRGYTLLLDPPNLRPAPAPLLPGASAPGAAVPAPTAPAPAQRPPATAPARVTAPAAAAPAAPQTESRQVTVVRGDTAGRIAAAHKPADATLEQMLIGLLRSNPQAFQGNNINRLKAGAVLDLPDAQAVNAIPAAEARQLVLAQSRDFNEFRRRLAAAAPAQATPAPGRAASGTVQTEVRDASAADASQDRLTLSKGADTAKETQIAEARQKEESGARVSELSRNLQELEQLKAAAQPAAAEPAPAAPAPAEAPPSAAAPAPEPAPAEAPPAAPTVAAAPPAPPPPAPAAPSTPLLPEALLASPYTMPAAGGLAALLGLLVLLRMRQRRQAQAQDADEGTESRFADAEGQSVDTSEAGPVSSMMYSPSQLDAGGDVDPVAEADVYLAYGRDKQAEEILLEALRLHPERLAVRAKLLELYAQRPDVAAYNAAAQALYELTGGEGPEWDQARETGLQLDASNPLYLSGGTVSKPDFGILTAQPAEPVREPEPEPVQEEPAAGAPDIDLSFDLDEPASAPVSQPAAPEPQEPSLEFDLDLTEPDKREAADNGLDFDLEIDDRPTDAPPPATELPEAVQDLSLDLDFEPAEPAKAVEEPAEPPLTANELEGLDDLSSLEVTDGGDADPLETKLSLAREFEAIGDTDGARSLAEEVEAEASGALKDRARAFLNQLS